MDRESQSSKPCTCATRYKEIIFICILWEYRLRTLGNSLKLSASANINTIWLVNFLKSTSGLLFFFFFSVFKAKFLFHKGKHFCKQDQLYTYSANNKLAREVSTMLINSGCYKWSPCWPWKFHTKMFFSVKWHFILRGDLKGKRRLSTQVPLKTWTELLIWVSNSYWLGADDRTLKTFEGPVCHAF